VVFVTFVAALAMGLALPPCPESPNCVSSQASDSDQQVKPFSYQGHALPTAKQALLKALSSLPRTEIVLEQGNHLKAAAKSRVFGFIDDLDFIFDDQNKLVQVRSASRVGYWDMGVNRRRVAKLSGAFQEALGAHQTGSPGSRDPAASR